MVRFNLEEYDMVENRIARFLDDYPDGRIVTYETTSKQDRERGYWVVRAQIFTDHEDQHMNCAKASGLAFEIEGTAGANQTSALENAETSAIGRALANAGYSGRKRPSQTEMAKVIRKDNPVPSEFVDEIKTAQTIDQLNKLWEVATDKGWASDVQKLFTARKQVLEQK